MRSRLTAAAVLTTASILVVGVTFAAQDKYTVQVPGGLSLSAFRGYEDWQTVSVSQTEERLKVILANPAMIDAFRAGIPENGSQFPDGAKMAKVEWTPQANAESPSPVNVPASLAAVGFMEKDSQRFSDTGGWGYAQFSYDPGSETFAPDENYVGDTACGHACHTIVEGRDFVFTHYANR